ncbi:hypothetical protein HDU93_001452 [Gonapodya sp. JEL0774]|nr:hypothetical protein HDU93_001452 [Gonapodya sp. JEL0774]
MDLSVPVKVEPGHSDNGSALGRASSILKGMEWKSQNISKRYPNPPAFRNGDVVWGLDSNLRAWFPVRVFDLYGDEPVAEDSLLPWKCDEHQRWEECSGCIIAKRFYDGKFNAPQSFAAAGSHAGESEPRVSDIFRFFKRVRIYTTTKPIPFQPWDSTTPNGDRELGLEISSLLKLLMQRAAEYYGDPQGFEWPEESSDCHGIGSEGHSFATRKRKATPSQRRIARPTSTTNVIKKKQKLRSEVRIPGSGALLLPTCFGASGDNAVGSSGVPLDWQHAGRETAAWLFPDPTNSSSTHTASDAPNMSSRRCKPPPLMHTPPHPPRSALARATLSRSIIKSSNRRVGGSYRIESLMRKAEAIVEKAWEEAELEAESETTIVEPQSLGNMSAADGRMMDSGSSLSSQLERDNENNEQNIGREFGFYMLESDRQRPTPVHAPESCTLREKRSGNLNDSNTQDERHPSKMEAEERIIGIQCEIHSISKRLALAISSTQRTADRLEKERQTRNVVEGRLKQATRQIATLRQEIQTLNNRMETFSMETAKRASEQNQAFTTECAKRELSEAMLKDTLEQRDRLRSALMETKSKQVARELTQETNSDKSLPSSELAVLKAENNALMKQLRTTKRKLKSARQKVTTAEEQVATMQKNMDQLQNGKRAAEQFGATSYVALQAVQERAREFAVCMTERNRLQVELKDMEDELEKARKDKVEAESVRAQIAQFECMLRAAWEEIQELTSDRDEIKRDRDEVRRQLWEAEYMVKHSTKLVLQWKKWGDEFLEWGRTTREALARAVAEKDDHHTRR